MTLSRFPVLVLLALLAAGPGAVATAQSAAEEAPPEAPAESAEAAVAAALAEAQGRFDAEEFATAADLFTAIVETSPAEGKAWFGLGRARHFQGDFAEALAAYQEALELGFNPPRVMFHAARAAAGNGDREAAIGWLGRLADTGQKSYLAVVGAEEFDAYRDDPEFRAVADRLRPCGGDEHHQFDFWVGEWEVANLARPDSEAPPAINRITSIHDGCVLREEYQAPSGFTGTSLNFFDPRDGLWHQTWIDNQGQALYLSGGLVEGTMVLADSPDDGPINRISWTPLVEGRVRQLWEVSTDGGEAWQVVFDGVYSRAEAGAAADRADDD